MSRSIFIDSSFFKAIIDPQDDFHIDSQNIWKKLEKERTTLVTSNYVLDESFTLIRIRCGLKVVDRFRKDLVESAQFFKIVRATIADEANAWEWFLKDWSKLSFTDCVSFAIMKRLNLVWAGTFDKHFVRAGFMQEEKTNKDYEEKITT